MPSLPFSVAISSYQEGARVHSTVMSILDSHPSPREVVIADDGSTDGSCEGPWPDNVRVLRLAHAGIAPARNASIAECHEPLVVVLDAHCSVERDWLLPLFDALVRQPVALLCGSVIDEGNPRYAGCGASVINDRLEYRWDPCSTERSVQIAPGGFLAFRRDVFMQAGGFGPFRDFGYEDVDLSLRWHALGRLVLAVPGSRVAQLFRTDAPYVHSSQSHVRNLLVTACRNLPSDLRLAVVHACSHLPGFAGAVAEVLCEAPALLSAEQMRRAVDALSRAVSSSSADTPAFAAH